MKNDLNKDLNPVFLNESLILNYGASKILCTSLVEVDAEVEADVGRESFEDLTEVIESDLRSKRSRRELNVLYQGSQY